MTGTWLACGLAILSGPPAPATDAPAARPAPSSEFKLVVTMFGAGKEPLATADLVARKGVAYQFITEAPAEVLVIDPRGSRLILLDLTRKVQTEVTSCRLDANLERLHRKLTAAVAAKEKSPSRADRVAASMTRDLIDPRFQETYDPRALRLRLKNPTVEVDAVGDREPDAERLMLTVNCLAAIMKLGALRDPDSLPPFTRLESLREIAAVHRLRPTEVSYLYRLAGPPRKLRWTYRLVPTLTEREGQALSRVDAIRRALPAVPYEHYEKTDED